MSVERVEQPEVGWCAACDDANTMLPFIENGTLLCVGCGRRSAAGDSVRPSLARETAFAAAPGSGALTWSVERPKRRGLWWWDRPGHEKEAVFIDPDGDVMEYFGGRWAGPLPEPVEPSDAEPLPNAGDELRAGGKRELES